jgi:hypothetical protein
MESEEPGSADERDREPENAGVAPACGCLTREEGERASDDSCRQDEPEVSGLVFPVDVEPRPGEENREPGDRNREERQASDCSSRTYSSLSKLFSGSGGRRCSVTSPSRST